MCNSERPLIGECTGDRHRQNSCPPRIPLPSFLNPGQHLLVLATLATVLMVLLTNVGCDADEVDLHVFAASSLRESFLEVGSLYEDRYPGTRVKFNFASSSMLGVQLTHGAKADVYASADKAQMWIAVEQGLIKGHPEPFATNQLVVIVSNDATRVRQFKDLASHGLKLAMGLPGVPIGTYSRHIIENTRTDPSYGMFFHDRILANVVSNELNVKQVVAKVILGEVDAGFVYSTDVTKNVEPLVRVVEIPSRLNVAPSYYVGALRGSHRSELAQQFVSLLGLIAAQGILEDHGFSKP